MKEEYHATPETPDRATPDGKGLTRRQLITMAGIAGVASTGILATERSWIDVRHENLLLPRWRAGKVRIGLVADLHVNNEDASAVSLLAAEELIRAKPDIVLIAGDTVNFSGDWQIAMLERFFDALGGLKCPIYGIMGNHEYDAEDLDRILRAFARSPMQLLRNEVADLHGFRVLGYDSALMRKADFELLRSEKGMHSTLALLHEPDYAPRVLNGVSLVMSGHTHGGQICLPLGYPLRLPPGGKVYVKGHYRVGSKPLFVTRGVGVTAFKLRTFCRPEVVIFDVDAQ